MNEYTVIWEIDIYANSPEEAAEKALAVQRDTDSMATVFQVWDSEGCYDIDLMEDYLDTEAG